MVSRRTPIKLSELGNLVGMYGVIGLFNGQIVRSSTGFELHSSISDRPRVIRVGDMLDVDKTPEDIYDSGNTRYYIVHSEEMPRG